jgi:hypothetical protein
MGGGKGKAPAAPPPIDPGKSMGEYLFGQGFKNYQGITDPRLQERLLGAEATYRPQYTALELADIATMARGLGDTPGLFDLLEEHSARAGELQREELQLQRESDVGALREFAPQVVDAYRAADPYSTGLADMASRQAETLYAEGEGELSPERRRMAEQAARMGSLARGRIGDESSIAAELLGREQVRSGLRAEARQAGGQAFSMQRQMAGDIGSVLLGRPSAAIGLGGQVLGQAQAGAAGPMGPQLFDPNVGINMALQQRGQDVTFQGMQAQAQASRSAGIMGAVGQIGGSLLGASATGTVGSAAIAAI